VLVLGCSAVFTVLEGLLAEDLDFTRFPLGFLRFALSWCFSSKMSDNEGDDMDYEGDDGADGGEDFGDEEKILSDEVREHDGTEDTEKSSAKAETEDDLDSNSSSSLADHADERKAHFFSPEEAYVMTKPNIRAVPRSEYMTTAYMTKYERARVLGTRALQISLGAPPLVEVGEETDCLEIAMKELRQKKIPIIIRRFLPDGLSYEDWKIDELALDIRDIQFRIEQIS